MGEHIKTITIATITKHQTHRQKLKTKEAKGNKTQNKKTSQINTNKQQINK